MTKKGRCLKAQSAYVIHQGQTTRGWLNAAGRSGNPAIWLSEPCLDRSPFRLHPPMGGHSAYRSAANETFLNNNGFVSHIHRKKPKGRAMHDTMRRANNAKSKIADIQAALIRQFDSRWAAGAGLRFVAPTGAEDITSGKWQALPVAGARYSLPELSAGSYAEALLRYDISFAGNPSKRNFSNLQLAPMLNINLPERWFVTLYPNTEIRVNYGDPVPGQSGRLFLPVDFMVGRNVTKTVTLSLEVSVPVIKDYPVYNFRTVTRVNMQF